MSSGSATVPSPTAQTAHRSARPDPYGPEVLTMTRPKWFLAVAGGFLASAAVLSAPAPKGGHAPMGGGRPGGAMPRPVARPMPAPAIARPQPAMPAIRPGPNVGP